MSESYSNEGLAELDPLTPGEAQLFAATDCDLEPRERRRILGVARALERGDYQKLFGLEPGASKRALQRACFELTAELHPRRYAGRRLGSFAPLLSHLFAEMAVAAKTIADARTLAPRQAAAGGPRRRSSRRRAAGVKIEARCSSWSRPREVAAQEISEQGAFLATEADARPGERVALVLSTPQGPLPLRATVVHRLELEQALRRRRLPGLGLRFDPLPAPKRRQLSTLLAALSKREPAPAKHVWPRRRLARGTGRVSPVIGIDLGTSYTSVSAEIGGEIAVLPFPGGSRSIPSVVAFPDSRRYIFGHQARERLLRDPAHAVPAVKRLLGAPDRDKRLEAHLARAPFPTSRASDGTVVVEMWGEPYAMVQICSYLFAAARDAACQALGTEVERAVATVPVSFSAEQVELLRRAARLARLELVDIIDEPSAAALANRAQPGFGGHVAVYDFGGGTFDFSLIDAGSGDLRVLAATGDSWLGGDDLDYSLADAVANRFWNAYGLDVRTRAVEWQCLLRECERAKRRLSIESEARVFVPEVMNARSGRVDLKVRLTRGPTERIWEPIIERSLAVCTQALALLGRRPTDLSGVFLSGGTTYVPAVRRALAARFAGVPIRCGAPPDLATCLGAGIHAAEIEHRGRPVLSARAPE